ncbi:MAG: replicative DNA helicase [Bacteroidales bacterium]|nr:replicative DNA helicase [Bacteroidales bacterium]
MAQAKYEKAGVGRNKKSPDLEETGLGMGKTPPQALDFERAVLAALLLDPECVEEVLGILTNPQAFYDERHRIVFEAARDLYNAHYPVDMMTLSQKLGSTILVKKEGGKKIEVKALDEIGGLDWLGELTDSMVPGADLEYYCKIVQQKFIQRELISATLKVLSDAYRDNINMEDLIATAQNEIFKAVDHNTSKEVQNISEVIKEAMMDIEKAQSATSRYSGVESGFPSLDDITLGFQPSDLIILAARPSVGKTAFALNVARNAAVDHNRPVAVFSLEMPAKQLVKRLMTSESHLNPKAIKGGEKLREEDWKQLENSIAALAAAPIYIDDTPSLPISEFRSKVKKLVKQKNVQLVVVDYLQLMTGPPDLRGFREQEVAAISRALKATAKDENIPIIALSQLSRNAVQRERSNNRPQLSDLRESGSIEQDADMVLFIHRADYQGLGGENVVKGDTELIIAKHRNGEIGDVKLVFHDSEARFSDAKFERFIPDEPSPAEETVEYASRMNSMSIDDMDGDAMADPNFE